METTEKSKFEEIFSNYLYQLSIHNFRSHHRRKKEQRKRPGCKLIEYARPILVCKKYPNLADQFNAVTNGTSHWHHNYPECDQSGAKHQVTQLFT